jgi:hypothetical protein
MTTTTPPVLVEPSQNWSCHQSGTCCGTFPHIPVDAEAARVMANHDYGRLQQETGLTVARFEEGVEPAPDDPRVSTGLRLRRHAPGPADPHLAGHPADCVFHCADQACGLHRIFGDRGKPQLCRDFPYRFRQTPSGTVIGLSFVCPSVRGNQGKPLVEQTEQLALHAAEAFAPQFHSGEVYLNPKLHMEWNDYLELESGLIELVERPALPLAVRLRALHIAVNMLDLLHQATHGATEPMAPPRGMATGFVPDALKALRKEGWSAVWRVAARPAKPALLQRMFLGMMTGFATSLWTPRHPALVGLGIFWHYARHASGWGSVQLRPLSGAAPHVCLAQVRFPAPTSNAGRLLDRYVRHSLFRKDLAFAPDVRRGLNLLLVNLALIRWYAAAHAFLRNRPVTEMIEEDWSEAMRHVETLYGLNSRLYQRLSDLPVLDAVLESTFRRKEFPFIITGER